MASRLVELALGVLMLAIPVQASAQAGGDADPILACEVMGHDVVIYNRGSDAIAAGTAIHWSVWMGRREGDHTLAGALEPFIGLRLSSALGGSYFWNRPCEASVAAQPAPNN